MPDTSLVISVDGSILFIKEKNYGDTCSRSGFAESTLSPLPARKLFPLTDITVMPFRDDIDSLGYPLDSIGKCFGRFFQKVKSASVK